MTRETKEALNGIFYVHKEFNWLNVAATNADRYATVYIYKGIIIKDSETFKELALSNMSVGALVNHFEGKIHPNYLYRKNKKPELLLNGKVFSGYYKVVGLDKILKIDEGFILDSLFEWDIKRTHNLSKTEYVIHDLFWSPSLLLSAGQSTVEEEEDKYTQDQEEILSVFEENLVNLDDALLELQTTVEDNYFTHVNLFPDDFCNTLQALTAINAELQKYAPIWENQDRID
jgi:hypothetical protein